MGAPPPRVRPVGGGGRVRTGSPSASSSVRGPTRPMLISASIGSDRKSCSARRPRSARSPSMCATALAVRRSWPHMRRRSLTRMVVGSSSSVRSRTFFSQARPSAESAATNPGWSSAWSGSSAAWSSNCWRRWSRVWPDSVRQRCQPSKEAPPTAALAAGDGAANSRPSSRRIPAALGDGGRGRLLPAEVQPQRRARVEEAVRDDVLQLDAATPQQPLRLVGHGPTLCARRRRRPGHLTCRRCP